MTRVESASPSMSSAMMTSGFLTWLASSRAGMMDWMLEIFFSENRTSASLYSTLAPLLVLMKYGLMYPRSNFIPSITSSSSYKVLPSLTVMTPSFPTFFMASEMSSPMAVSPLALIVATWAISAGVVPSPACSLVLLATSWTSLAPMFWNLSGSSTALATVTPSLVILGDPQEDSITTFRPLGPIVTETASASTSTPFSISARTSAPNLTSLA